MKSLDKHDVVVQAIEKLKGSEFGATAVKVELEAHLERGNNCGNCENGRRTCYECDGGWEGSRCDNDCDEGSFRCEAECEDGFVVNSEGVATDERCQECENDGWNNCEECYEEGYYANCEYCDEGTQDCEDCDGELTNFADVFYCHEWFMEKLSHLGLAERREETTLHKHSNRDTYWFPKAPLVFGEFYNDGSVDSEFTFTISLDSPENIFLLPKVIGVFNEFAEQINGDRPINVTGAGMHMALLNTPDCSYPTNTVSSLDRTRHENFRKSMNLLMPALFFLASSNENSRGMGYRRPEIGMDTHRSAIDYRGGALEFRVFDTCYENPDTILDNIVVISKCMKYWTIEYTKNNLRKLVPKGCRFGVEGSQKLDRFYVTVEQLQLLNAGLPKLKPDYYTVGEIKQQRKFSTTKTHVKDRVKRVRKEAEIQYTEYEDRFNWNIEIRKLNLRAQFLESTVFNIPPAERMVADRNALDIQVTEKVAKKLDEFIASKQDLEKYIEETLAQDERKNVGEFQLS